MYGDQCIKKDASGGIFSEESTEALYKRQGWAAHKMYSNWSGHGQEASRPWLQTKQ